MSNLLADPKWYVLYIRHNFVHTVARDIRELNFDCFLPTRTTFRKWSDRIKKIEEPLFPGYLFIKTTLTEASRFLHLEGVMRYICSNGKPLPVRDWEMDRLLLLISSDKQITVEPYCSVGDPVEVTDGPFIGMEGILVKKCGQSRLLVHLPVLKQAISVEMPAKHLKLSGKKQLA